MSKQGKRARYDNNKGAFLKAAGSVVNRHRQEVPHSLKNELQRDAAVFAARVNELREGIGVLDAAFSKHGLKANERTAMIDPFLREELFDNNALKEYADMIKSLPKSNREAISVFLYSLMKQSGGDAVDDFLFTKQELQSIARASQPVIAALTEKLVAAKPDVEAEIKDQIRGLKSNPEYARVAAHKYRVYGANGKRPSAAIESQQQSTGGSAKAE